ncbi:MAG: hypothetical protein JKY92_09320, partial [Magnetovibrio sp.]|nr:hypothetical protein [Magnetovibrio sp.]
MSALPGHLQAVFTAGELDPSLHERFELKYFSTGCRKARNVQFLPQGGFVMRPGLMDAGGAAATATRLVAFHSSDGKSYQLTLSDKQIEVWHDGVKTYEFAAGSINLDYLTDMSFASSQDEMLCFHEDMPSQQIIHLGPVAWTIADVPLENLPLYDYGENYTNGVPAVWQLEFIGLTDTSVFTLTVSRLRTY